MIITKDKKYKTLRDKCKVKIHSIYDDYVIGEYFSVDDVEWIPAKWSIKGRFDMLDVSYPHPFDLVEVEPEYVLKIRGLNYDFYIDSKKVAEIPNGKYKLIPIK